MDMLDTLNFVCSHQKLSCFEERLEDLVKHADSALLSFDKFFQRGTTPQESVTIQSMKRVLCDHYSSLFKILSECPDGWKEYGEFDEESKSFEFFPERIVFPLRSQFQLQEYMVFTQLFVGFMEEKKDTYINQVSTSSAAIFIATWLSFRWRWCLKKETQKFVDNFARMDCSRGANDMGSTRSGFFGWNSK